MGPTQLADVLRQLPRSVDPNLLVGFETSDDAGVLRLSDDLALVQTVDFFTPIVDDPYAFGQIAAANALSDIYAMGGKPVSALNIACFTPSMAPPEVWAAILQGGFDKTVEARAVVLGGHSVEDPEPKFGMAVTGLLNPHHMFANTTAKPGDRIWLTKPLGTGIITTAAKNDACSKETLDAAITSMSELNRRAAEVGLEAGVQCATDITGFGLLGHLYNVARNSNLAIEVVADSLPLLPDVQALISAGQVTGGAAKNRDFLGQALTIESSVPDWLQQLALDPQTSGGLALFSPKDLGIGVEIGRVVAGGRSIRLV